jgi:replicative DNA helicase
MEILRDLAVEVAILGGVISDPTAFYEAAEIIGESDFADTGHAFIWATIADRILAGRPVSGAAIAKDIEDAGRLEDVGGKLALARMLDGAAYGPEIVDFARILSDLSARRRIVETLDRLRAQALQPVDGKRQRVKPAQMLETAILALQADHATVAPVATGQLITVTAQELAAAVRPETRSGVETGLAPLDQILGEMYRQELTIIAGRPSMGKSALVEQIEFNVARRGGAVLKFSIEMGGAQIAYRTASRAVQARTGEVIPASKLRRASALRDRELGLIKESVEALPKSLWVDTSPHVDLAYIRAAMTRLQRKVGQIDLVTIDYLQLMDHRRDRGETDNSAISRTTRGLKLLAKEFDCAVVALSQLSREVERRDDKRPQLSDLRDSGAIEQDADAVIFVLRQHYYESRKTPPTDRGKLEEHDALLADLEPRMTAIVAKQRMGPLGDANLYWCAQSAFVCSDRNGLLGPMADASSGEGYWQQ